MGIGVWKAMTKMLVHFWMVMKDIVDVIVEVRPSSGCNPGCGAHKLQRKLFIFYFLPLCPSLPFQLSLPCSFYENIQAVDHSREREREREEALGFSIVSKVNTYVAKECFVSYAH